MAVAGIVIATVPGSSRSAPASIPSEPSGVVTNTAALRQTALQHLMHRRSAAILSHDRNAFAATLDPRSPAFRRQQLTMFANLRRVHFASWSYSFDLSGQQASAKRRHSYRARTWSPNSFSLHYRIAGFDPRPTDLPQYPTFVRRGGRWYLASLDDFRSQGDISATGLWDYGPVHVVRRPGVLALGPADKLGTMVAAADEMRAAIPRVMSVWGHDWARRVVVLVPATQHEMALIDADAGDLDQIAALTSSEVTRTFGRPQPVGDRVTLNPANWSKVGPLGARIVLTHELTHVATRADTGSQTPKWLSEGFAEYVGFLGTGVPVAIEASELSSDLRTHRDILRELPANRDFRGSSSSLAEAYEASLLACRYLADRYGQAKLVRFYRAVGTSSDRQVEAVAHGLRQVFNLTPPEFTSRWRGYVDGQLG
jgi:hypothetical protein